MNFKESVRSLNSDPFAFFDNLNLVFKGNNFNIFQKYRHLQKVAFGVAIVSVAAWVVMGFDSTPLQVVNVFVDVHYGFLSWLFGHAKFADVVNVYNSFYGKEMHWSAFVIYMGMFYVLSKHFDKLGIVKSKNVAYACSITFMSIAMFEFFWMGSFAYFQNQWWVVTWQMPQLRIILQNCVFALVGGLGTLYMFLDSFILKDKQIIGRAYRFNVKSAITIGLCLATVILILVWWYYPWTTQQQISVQLLNGNVWQSNIHRFPQTLYTIKTDPLSSNNGGTWFWVSDDAVHALNTILKFVWAAAVGSVFMLKKEKNAR